MVIDLIRLLLKTCFYLLDGKVRRRGDARSLKVRTLCLFVRFLLGDSLRKGVPWLRSRQRILSRLSTRSLPVTYTRIDAGGVPALKCLPLGLEAPERWIVYFHGGGYVTGSADDSRDTLARLALSAKAAVLGVDYRLAPEAVFPAAHEDSLMATRYVFEQAGGANRVALAGDSAGAALCVGTLMALRDGGSALPAACVLMSPWVDPFARGGSMIDKLETDILNPEVLDFWLEGYLQGQDTKLPEINLMQARLNSLPPILIQYGEAEILRDQILAFSLRLQEAGVEVSVAGYAGQFHVFQCLFGLLRCGREALQQAGSFLSRHLTGRGDEVSVGRLDHH